MYMHIFFSPRRVFSCSSLCAVWVVFALAPVFSGCHRARFSTSTKGSAKTRHAVAMPREKPPKARASSNAASPRPRSRLNAPPATRLKGKVVHRYPKVFVTDSIAVGFLCSSCARNTVCRRRWIKGNQSRWKALVNTPQKTRFKFAPGVFGPPGGGPIRGRAWKLYLVFPGPKLPPKKQKWRVVLAGVQPFVSPAYVNAFGALIVELTLFADQFKGGRTVLAVAAPDATVIYRKKVTLTARPPKGL